MKTNLSLFLGVILLISGLFLKAQTNSQKEVEQWMNNQVDQHLNQSYQTIKSSFDKAYQHYPSIPRGLLEAISFVNTRFTHRSYTEELDKAGIGMPRTYGVMGLTLDGQNYFRDNLKKVSSLSKIPIDRIISNPDDNVMAYASAFFAVALQKNIQSKNVEAYIPVVIELCELPLNSSVQNDYAMNTFLYGVFDFLNKDTYSNRFHFPNYNVDLKELFGANYTVLSSSYVTIDQNGIRTKEEKPYQLLPKSSSSSKNIESTDYGPAIWNAAASCNYTVGRTSPISAVAVHYTAGSYAGSISWFQNCSAQSSAHYCLRSSDGQITQMVKEADKAWHVRNENPYTIGLEHEAIEPVQNYFTVAMYQSSAALVRDICASGYGISPLRIFYRDTLDDGTALDFGMHSLGNEGSCTKIKGHQHFPNNTHTDPGPYWNWDYYFKLVNNTTPVTTYNTPTGVFTDDGGASGNYSVDNRKLYLIEIPGASQITLSFTQFALETNYDFMYIYDGNSVYSPKIGRYNTLNPGVITSSGNQLLIEFRSDCATSAAGWVANWTSVTPDIIPPSTAISQPDSMWVTADYTTSFTDSDNLGGSGVDRKFYQVMFYNGQEWTANQNRGFVVDNFDLFNTSKWKIPSGNVAWSASANALQVLDTNTDNSNIYSALNGTLSNSYIYDFYAKIDGTSTNKRFGFHFASDSATLSNRGNSYFIYIRPGSNQLEFYRVANNTFTQTNVVTGVVTNLNQYYHYKIVHNRISGLIEVFRDDILLGSWTDPTPLSTPSKYFSFRTARTQMWVKSMRVYRSRTSPLMVNVGADLEDDIQMQSKNSSIAAKIKSVIVDNNNNYSLLVSKEMRVDWTKPANVSVIDGSSGDLDVFGTQGIIRGSWTPAIDTNSGIQRYQYAIGTSLGASDIVGWTDNGLNMSFEKTGLTLIDGTTYYIMVKSQNGAGLWSDSASSDGAVFHLQPIADFSANTQQICTGGSVQFTNLSANTSGQTWYFTGGSPATSIFANPTVTYTSAGTYAVKLVVTGVSGADSVIRSSYINVQATPLGPSIVSNPTICQGSTTQLEVSGSATLNWYASISGGTVLGTGTTLNTTPLDGSTSYYVRSEIGTCISSMTTINVLVEPMPATPQLSTPTPICSGTTSQITATGTATIKWYSDNLANNLAYTGASITTSPLTETTTYYVRTETTNCITPMSSVTVEVKPIPEIPIISSTQECCYGDSLMLNAVSNDEVYWYNQTSNLTPIYIGNSYQTPPLHNSDTLYLKSKLDGCFSNPSRIEIHVTPLPLAPILTLNGGEICSNVGSNLLWYYNSLLQDSIVSPCFLPVLNGSYSARVLNSSGCQSEISNIIVYSQVTVDDLGVVDCFEIIPNPASAFLVIKQKKQVSIYNVKLLNALGKIVLSLPSNIGKTGDFVMDISALSHGVYFVYIETNQGFFIQKIIIQK